MGLSDIVRVNIDATSLTAERAGFGVPLIAAYHTEYLDLVREYTTLTGLVDDGFTSSSTVYKMANAIFGQEPRPPKIKVGRRATPSTQKVTLTVTSAGEGVVYSGAINGQEFSYTVGASATTTTVATALEVIIDALTGAWTSSASGAVITIDADTPGDRLVFSDLCREFEYKETTADPGLADDLDDIVGFDNDWYALLIDSNGHAENLAAAAWTESKRKIFGATTSDAGAKSNAVTTDIMSALQDAAYARTVIMYSESPYASCGWFGKMLPEDPGSENWAFKQLAGIPYSRLTDTQQAAIQNKNGNYYTRILSVNTSWRGRTPSGEWIDIIRSRDWIVARIEEAVFNVQINNKKVPYTDLGADMICGAIRSVLNQGVAFNMIDTDDPAPFATAPSVASVDPALRADRILPGIRFGFRFTGAANELDIDGTASF